MKILSFLILSLFLFSSGINAQWYQQNSGTSNRLLTCFFLNENEGWAAGYDGSIVKTTNGGINWISQSL